MYLCLHWATRTEFLFKLPMLGKLHAQVRKREIKQRNNKVFKALVFNNPHQFSSIYTFTLPFILSLYQMWCLINVICYSKNGPCDYSGSCIITLHRQHEPATSGISAEVQQILYLKVYCSSPSQHSLYVLCWNPVRAIFLVLTHIPYIVQYIGTQLL